MWIIYYSDGDCFSGAYEVEDLPTRDVQVIVQTDMDAGWITQSGTDYYIWKDNRWYGVDSFGMFDYLASPGWKKVLFGRYITSDEYNDIMSLALNDERLPKKTSGSRTERWVRI